MNKLNGKFQYVCTYFDEYFKADVENNENGALCIELSVFFLSSFVDILLNSTIYFMNRQVSHKKSHSN